MTPQLKTYGITALTALAVAGTLAGCAAPAATTDDTAPDTTETTEEATDGTATDGTTTEGSTGAYADGTYEATGEYQSPNGTESIDVTVTLAAGVVTDVEVVSNAENPNSVRYQGEFIDGISDEVVGVAIDDLDVDKVGGSSLTSGGFNAAIDEIKADAAA